MLYTALIDLRHMTRLPLSLTCYVAFIDHRQLSLIDNTVYNKTTLNQSFRLHIECQASQLIDRGHLAGILA